MSSHREAPAISKDPTADSTDVYAFVTPSDPSTVTLIANYIPLEAPDGGPNFYEFADDVRYQINIDNDGDGYRNIAFEFDFTTVNAIPGSFLYNDGPITSLTGDGAALWNRKQTYTLTRIDFASPSDNDGTRRVLGTGLTVPPCNIGPLSTPDYESLVAEAIHSVSADGYSATSFAGQRAEGFYVDLGAVFDLGGLRPFEQYHLGGQLANMPGVNSTADVNVHSLALQIPVTELTHGGTTPTSTQASNAVIGVWTEARRQKARVFDGANPPMESGPYAQVSRLGNPLVNELLIGLGDKDRWNMSIPYTDGSATFFPYFANPLLGQLLPELYTNDGSTIFPNLAKYNKANTGTTKAKAARPDIVAILLTGIPASVLGDSGLPPTNVGGTGVADMLRLNVAQPPTDPSSKSFSIMGYLGGDPAGFPNGRRVYDDVATIELRAVAGTTLPLVADYTPDAPTGTIGENPNDVISFGLTSSGTDTTAKGTESYLSSFPYLGTPYSGYYNPSTTPASSAS